MTRIFTALPWIFILLRAFSGILYGYYCFTELDSDRMLFVLATLFHIGFWGDILDGIIARRLGTDTTLMRKSDSFADVLFWVGLTLFCYTLFPLSQSPLVFGLLSITPLIVFDYVHCYFKFKKSPSAHALLSKFWGILLYVYFCSLFMNASGVLFGFIVFSFGLIARLDSTLIYIILRKWTHDIPSFVHAIHINKGLPIKRSTLFHSHEK